MKSKGLDGGLHFWLTANSTPVSYAKVYNHTDSPVDPHVELCDIETRLEYRNHGYAKLLLNMIAEQFAVPYITHTGIYTPNGLDYIAKHVNSTDNTPTIEAEAEPMAFVYSWDSFAQKYS